MVTLAPVLDHKDSKVMISISPPTNVLSASGAKAAIHFYSSSGGKQFYDAKSGSILDCGKTAEVISLRRGTTKRNFEVVNLAGGVAYTASVAYRCANDFDWGAESPASAPFKVVPPVAPQAPRLEPVSTVTPETDVDDTDAEGIRVHFAAPPGCAKVNVIFWDGKSEQRVTPNFKLGPNDCGGKTCGSLGPSIVVTGLSIESIYDAGVQVALEAHNGCWGPRGPWSKPLKFTDYAPEPPCEPVIDSITEDSVRVSFSLLQDCMHGGLSFFKGTKKLGFDFSSGTLIGQAPLEKAFGNYMGPASDCKKGLVVSGLQPDTTYRVHCAAWNAFGWSGRSPDSTFRTLPEDVVEITGTRTQAERDAELRKRALDVDAHSPPKKKNRGRNRRSRGRDGGRGGDRGRGGAAADDEN